MLREPARKDLVEHRHRLQPKPPELSRHPHREKVRVACVGVSLLKVGEKRPAYMSQEKFEQLYAQAANLIDRTVLVVFYTGGLRRKEGFCLTWDDVDFGRSIVHVARRRKDGYVQAWTPKDHERREIPLPQKAMDLLKQLKKQAPKDCPYVFMDAGRSGLLRMR
jgi:integrase